MEYQHYKNEAKENGRYAIYAAFATAAVGALGVFGVDDYLNGIDSTDYIAIGAFCVVLLGSAIITAGFGMTWHQARKYSHFSLP